jgi:alkane 1-monooxygenase
MGVVKYGSPFVFLALVPAGYAAGGLGAFVLLPAMPLALTSLDWLMGRESRDAGVSGAAYRLLPYLYIPAQLALIVWAGWAIAQPATTLLEATGLTLSCGLTAGVFGFLAAHEMVHSPHPAERAYGLLMLAGLLYMQFAIAHLVGHHRRAATFEDPATARRGESAYAFLVRSIGGQARESWAHERERLSRAGKPVIGPGNRLIVWGLIELAVVVAVGLFSWRALAFFLAQAALAIVMLELFNYIAHYGLMRRRLPSGALERLGPQHSWNSARRMNNWSLFNMGRHADHHRFSARPYHALEVLPGGSELPSGYAAAILLSLIPPLWRRVMDPRVDAAMGSPTPG